jgi:ABC-2 type transport system permease protein/sodium transport system permease protein
MRENSNRPSEPLSAGRRQLIGRLRRLVLKELREILRDRRTIITLVVMPILIYPLLAVVFQRFLLTSITTTEQVEYVIGVDSKRTEEILFQQLQAGEVELRRRREAADAEESEIERKPAGLPAIEVHDDSSNDPPPKLYFPIVSDDDAERNVIDSRVHIVAVHERNARSESDDGLQTPTSWELIYRAGSPTSEAALHFVESRLQAFNDLDLNQQLRRLGVTADLPAGTQRHPISFSGAPIRSLAALIPLILVLMTVTGAVYPAIDVTAGERERGTLETLIAAPVPRLGLLMAKYVAVLTVALLTAIVNLTAMTITAQSTNLGSTLFGGGLTFDVAVKVLLLLALFAAFFSAILLALTSCARSFKEAQAYIIPLMLVCLVPGVLCLLPNVEFSRWMAVTPLVNIVMLARDLLEGTVVTHLAVASVCSTLLYIAAAITLAARIFGTDAILYGSPATWSDLVRRPAEPVRANTLPATMLGLALMFPAYFVLASGLARSNDLPMERRLMVIGAITAAVFGGIPLVITMFGRVRWSSGLAMRRPAIGALFAAVLFGVALWPIAHEIMLFSKWLGLSMLGKEQLAQAETMLKQMRTAPLWLVLCTMALVPAVFEELCFRGFLFGALRTKLGDDRTVIASSLLFGVFHEVLMPGRLLVSTFLGGVLGWVRLRSGSLLPGILLHATHNGLILTAAHYHEELSKLWWAPEGEEHFPAIWIAGAVVGVAVASGLLMLSTQENTQADLNETHATG